MFQWENGGEWCRNLPLSEIYADLDGGDRVCRVTYAAFMKQDLSNAGGMRPMKRGFPA